MLKDPAILAPTRPFFYELSCTAKAESTSGFALFTWRWISHCIIAGRISSNQRCANSEKRAESGLNKPEPKSAVLLCET